MRMRCKGFAHREGAPTSRVILQVECRSHTSRIACGIESSFQARPRARTLHRFQHCRFCNANARSVSWRACQRGAFTHRRARLCGRRLSPVLLRHRHRRHRAGGFQAGGEDPARNDALRLLRFRRRDRKPAELSLPALRSTRLAISARAGNWKLNPSRLMKSRKRYDHPDR